jgi:hypothetical protein
MTVLAAATDFVDVHQKVSWVSINPIRAGKFEFVLTVAAGKETHPK